MKYSEVVHKNVRKLEAYVEEHILNYSQKPHAIALLARFPFLSPTGSLLLLRFLILISVVLNLISMIGFEEPGVIAILMFTFCLS